MSLRHFVLTSLNVPRDARALDPDHLDPLLRRLARFSALSLKAQTNQRFTWIIQADIETPEPQAFYLRWLAKIRPARIVWSYPRADLDWSWTVLDQLLWNPPEPRYVLTTSLPAGGALHSRSLEAIHGAAHGTGEGVQEGTLCDKAIILGGGVMFDEEAGRGRTVTTRFNTFVSLMEIFNGSFIPRTSEDGELEAEAWSRDGPRTIPCRAGWLETVRHPLGAETELIDLGQFGTS